MAEVNQQNIEKFRKAYKQAIKDGKIVFDFDGTEVLVAYAKYLIEYHDRTIKGRSK